MVDCIDFAVDLVVLYRSKVEVLWASSRPSNCLLAGLNWKVQPFGGANSQSTQK